jgi:hypothetical protein
MTTLRAVALAPAAAGWLAAASAARVLNVFERACNLINEEGTVLGLVTTERGLGPFAMVVEGEARAPFRGLPADSPVRVQPEAQVLSIGPLRIEYGTAARWDARPDWVDVARHYAGQAGSPARLAEMAEAVELSGSLLDLYRPALRGTALSQALLTMARPGSQALVGGLAAGDGEQAMTGARALAGLGGGLTPAGDDFIVGALLAAWAGLYGPGTAALGPGVAGAAVPRTTTLSAAYLKAAAQGECIAQWHALFRAQQREDLGATRAAVGALVSIGHTSGADALAGFLAVHYVLGRGSAPEAPARPAGG